MFAAAVIPGVALGVGMFYHVPHPALAGHAGPLGRGRAGDGAVNPGANEEEIECHAGRPRGPEQRHPARAARPGVRGALIAGLGLAVLQQFVGPNTVLFYGPTIFSYAASRPGPAGSSTEILVGAVAVLLRVRRLSPSSTSSAARSSSTSAWPAWAACSCCWAWPSTSAHRAGDWGCWRSCSSTSAVLALYLPAVLADDRRVVPQPPARRSAPAPRPWPTGRPTC